MRAEVAAGPYLRSEVWGTRQVGRRPTVRFAHEWALEMLCGEAVRTIRDHAEQHPA